MAMGSLPKKRTMGAKHEAPTEMKGALKNSAGLALDTRLAALYTTLSTTSDLNALIDLIDVLREHLLLRNDERHAIALRKGIQFLVRSMTTLLQEGRLPVHNVRDDGMIIITTTRASREKDSSTESDAQNTVLHWLQARWNDVICLLCQLLGCQDEATRITSLHSLMNLQRASSSALSKRSISSPTSSSHTLHVRAQWSRSPWRAIMSALLDGPPGLGTEARGSSVPSDVSGTFVDKYLQEYDDVRYAFCHYLDQVLRSKESDSCSQQARSNALRLLLGITAIPTKPQHLNTFWVKEMEENEKFARKEMKNSRKAGKESEGGGKGGQEDADVEDEIEDWFSESDDEGPSGQSTRNSAAGLGQAAAKAANAHAGRRRLRRNPAFCDAVFSLPAQRSAFSRAWLAVLLPTQAGTLTVGGSLSDSMVHEALIRMHTQVLPHLSKPNMLHDFLVDALDAGGATALLALNTLFTLMTKHNLNYPSFYTRLYALLHADPPVLHVRYRSRFLRLLNVFLSSTHLPAALIASFAKRLSRMALRAPPAAIVVVVPFVWNLCKRHKHCLGLLHREFGSDRFDLGPIGLADPYDPTEKDPLKTRAIESSLWELASMGSLIGAAQHAAADDDSAGQAHYLASVSSLSRILAEPFTKERYGLEDFLDLTYGTMFDTEVGKTMKRREGKKVFEPAVRFDLPRSQNGKRALTFGQQSGVDEELPGKRAKLVEGEGEEEEDIDVRNGLEGEDSEERKAMEASQVSIPTDVCSRLFGF